MLRLLRWWEIVVLLLIIVGIVTRARADPLRKARLSEPRAAGLSGEEACLVLTFSRGVRF